MQPFYNLVYYVMREMSLSVPQDDIVDDISVTFSGIHALFSSPCE